MHTTDVVCITQKAMAVLFVLWWSSKLMKYVCGNVGDICPGAPSKLWFSCLWVTTKNNAKLFHNDITALNCYSWNCTRTSTSLKALHNLAVARLLENHLNIVMVNLPSKLPLLYLSFRKIYSLLRRDINCGLIVGCRLRYRYVLLCFY